MKWATRTMADLAGREVTQYEWDGRAWTGLGESRNELEQLRQENAE